MYSKTRKQIRKLKNEVNFLSFLLKNETDKSFNLECLLNNSRYDFEESNKCIQEEKRAEEAEFEELLSILMTH